MNPEQLGLEALVASRAMNDAIRLIRAHEGRITPTLSKSDASPVTVLDFAVQAVIAARLARELPDDVLVAEEDASDLRGATSTLADQVADLVRRVVPDADTTHVLDWVDRGCANPSRRFWTLDPVDGTKGLLRGGQYVTAISLVVDSRVQVGGIACPHLSLSHAEVTRIAERAANGGVAVAVRGRGAWWAPSDGNHLTQLTVSGQSDPSAARVLRSYEERHGDPARFDRTLRALRTEVPPILMDSQAKHVTLAAGIVDLLMRFPPDRDFRDAIWDVAAGSLLIEESGGRVTDVAGRELDFTAGRRLEHNEGFLGSNGVLHEAALAAIRAAQDAA